MIPPEVEEYLDRARRYWAQSQEQWVKGEREKATELAWGSAVEMVKALALTGGQKLRTHGEVRNFVRSLANAHSDPELYHLFADAEAAHSNFYEGFMDETRVSEVLVNLRKLSDKISKSLPS